jgi:hypothetical protein
MAFIQSATSGKIENCDDPSNNPHLLETVRVKKLTYLGLPIILSVRYQGNKFTLHRPTYDIYSEWQTQICYSTLHCSQYLRHGISKEPKIWPVPLIQRYESILRQLAEVFLHHLYRLSTLGRVHHQTGIEHLAQTSHVHHHLLLLLIVQVDHVGVVRQAWGAV